MKDLSKEEILRQQISIMEDACEKRKWERVKKTFFVLSGVVYLIAFMCDGMKDIKNYLLWLLGAPIVAGFIMFISLIVLLYIIIGADEDNKAIAKLKARLNTNEFDEYE